MGVETQVIVKIDGPDGSRELVLQAGLSSIGRQPGNTLVLDSPQVSRKHAQIEIREGQVRITDLGSANGTRVDGEIIGQQLAFNLVDGSVIRIGPFEMRVEIKEIQTAPVGERKGDEHLSQAPDEMEKKEKIEAKASEARKPRLRKEVDAGGGEPPDTIHKASQPQAVPPEITVASLLGMRSQKLIHYLPGIYQTDFLERFLGLFESILLPIEWTIDHFDLYLDVDTSPAGFLSWLAGWFGVFFDSTWSEHQQRQFLREAAEIYARRGTAWSLTRLLEIYTGMKPEIHDQGNEIRPFHFEVVFKKGIGSAQRALVEQLIDTNKPAHSFYTLKIG